jgi:hypothetical protein
MIFSSTQVGICVKSKPTHNRWKQVHSHQMGMDVYQYVCPTELVKAYRSSLSSTPTPTVTNLGAVDVGGQST